MNEKTFKKKLQGKDVGMAEFDPKILVALQKLSVKEKKEFCEKLKKNTFKVEGIIMEEVYREGILTKKEYEKTYRHKYIDPNHGGDSFPELMQAVLAIKRNPEEKMIFITTNPKVLNDREKLSKKFRIKIKDPKEAIEMMSKELKKAEIKEVFQAM